MARSSKKKANKSAVKYSQPNRKDLFTSNYEPVEIKAAFLTSADFIKIEDAGHLKLSQRVRREINLEIQTMLSMQQKERTAFKRKDIQAALNKFLKQLGDISKLLTCKENTAEAKAEDKIVDQLCLMNYDSIYQTLELPKAHKGLNPPMYRMIDGEKVTARVDLNKFKVDVENILEATRATIADYKNTSIDRGGNDTALAVNEFCSAINALFVSAGGDKKFFERFLLALIGQIPQPFRPKISDNIHSTRKYIKRLLKSK